MEDAYINVPEWDYLELTCVRFPKNDAFGELLAFVSLTPFVILISHGTLCIALMDPHVITFLTGSLANVALNSILKRAVGELRPVATYRVDNHKYMPYGMPSSHSQFMAFFVVYVCLYTLMEVPHFGRPWEAPKKLAFLFSLALLAWLVIYGRVYLVYHSFEQVVYGTVLGGLVAFIWFWVTQNCLRPRYPDMRKTFKRYMGTTRLRHVPDYSVYLEEASRQVEDLKHHKKKWQEAEGKVE